MYTLNIYSYDELNKNAKINAHNYIDNFVQDYNTDTMNDIMSVYTKICNFLNLEMIDYKIKPFGYSFIKLKDLNNTFSDVDGLRGVRAFKYIMNKIVCPFIADYKIGGKFYIAGTTYKHSKVIIDLEYPFTGTTYDIVFSEWLKNIKHAIKYGAELSVENMINRLGYLMAKQAQWALESTLTNDNGAIDEILSEHEYFEDGSLYK